MESPIKLPLHIEHLARALEGSPSTEQVLLDHLTDTSQDIGLYHIYLRLGYSPETAAFQHCPTRVEVLRFLSEEYGQAKEDDLTHTDLKEEFYRTFRAKQIDQFSTPGSLGLSSVETSDELPQGMFDESSLVDFWGNGAPQRPVKVKLDFETPHKAFDVEGKSSKGLRSVSLKVKEILRQRGKASYKDIADVLVRQLDLPVWVDRSKEEKNIRRRVYDALNVLIAAGIIERDGREIAMASQHAAVHSEDDEELMSLKRSVREKQHQLRELAYSSMAMTQLISRNQLEESEERIHFPFIVVATRDSSDNSVSITVNSERQKVKMGFVMETLTVGDSDIVRMLPFQKPWNMESLPKGVRLLLKESPVYLFN
jgi:hypothetical protein